MDWDKYESLVLENYELALECIANIEKEAILGTAEYTGICRALVLLGLPDPDDG